MADSKIKFFIHAARPKTLTASLVPIVVATALARADGIHLQWWISGLALLGALCIQIATNMINDSIDFVKGADTETRLGEARASAQNWFTHKQVFAIGIGFLILALLCGLPLILVGGWPIVAVGLVSVFMAYSYTGGPFPLAYLGLGDLFVILFFGLIAVGGVYYLQTGDWSGQALVAGLQVGLLATVLIAVNNIRDMMQDKLVHKKTLSVRLGSRFAKWEVPVLFLLAFSLNIYWVRQGWWAAALLPLICLPLAIYVQLQVLKTEPSRQYNQFLALSSLVHLSFGVLLSVGFVLS
jgi:1,4-dihydroxy-2-naphthoate octaprenyltransferase